MATHSKTRSTIPRAGQTTLPTLPSLEQPLPVLSPDQSKPKRADPLAKHLWPTTPKRP